MNLKRLVRKNIWNLQPYSSARSEYKDISGILLDANENSLGSVLGNGLNRYPDPSQEKLKSILAKQKKISGDKIFVGNGSDEAIDLLIRTFCEPGHDDIIIFPPTYGIYSVFAKTNDVGVIQVNQSTDFALDIETYKKYFTENVKITFICDPNNPSGNCYSGSQIEAILSFSSSIIVIDEAYIDFAGRESWLTKLDRYPNLVILQTLSKAWGLAGIRIGMAYASEAIIEILNKIKYPYNVNQMTQIAAIEAIENPGKKDTFVSEILTQRTFLADALQQLNIVKKVYASDANFLLVRFTDAGIVYRHLLNNNIVVRDRSNQLHCENCLRITVGSKQENITLLNQLNKLDT